MGAQGTATLDFGASTQRSESASVAVTGQAGILSASSLVEAWISLETATAEHSTDEHQMDPPRVQAGTIVNATGFTIYGFADPPVYGTWTVNWVWN